MTALLTISATPFTNVAHLLSTLNMYINNNDNNKYNFINRTCLESIIKHTKNNNSNLTNNCRINNSNMYDNNKNNNWKGYNPGQM